MNNSASLMGAITKEAEAMAAYETLASAKPAHASHDNLIKELVSEQDVTRDLISSLFGQVASYVIEPYKYPETPTVNPRRPAVESPLGSALNAVVEVQCSLNAELRSLIARIAP